jgi:hypothetical protein
MVCDSSISTCPGVPSNAMQSVDHFSAQPQMSIDPAQSGAGEASSDFAADFSSFNLLIAGATKGGGSDLGQQIKDLVSKAKDARSQGRRSALMKQANKLRKQLSKQKKAGKKVKTKKARGNKMVMIDPIFAKPIPNAAAAAGAAAVVAGCLAFLVDVALAGARGATAIAGGLLLVPAPMLEGALSDEPRDGGVI